MNWDMIAGLLRHLFTVGGGALVTKGYVDATQVETLIGAAIAVIGVVWSVWSKRRKA